MPEPADVALVTAPAMHAPAAEMVHMLLDSPEAAATGPTAIAAEASAAEALAAEALATPSQAAAEGSSAPPSAHGQPVRSARHATRHAPGRNHGLRFRSGAGLEAGVRGKARSRGRAGVMSEAAAATAEKGGNVGDGDKRQYSDINDPPEWLLVKKLEPPGLPTTPPPPPLEMVRIAQPHAPLVCPQTNGVLASLRRSRRRRLPHSRTPRWSATRLLLCERRLRPLPLELPLTHIPRLVRPRTSALSQ